MAIDFNTTFHALLEGSLAVRVNGGYATSSSLEVFRHAEDGTHYYGGKMGFWVGLAVPGTLPEYEEGEDRSRAMSQLWQLYSLGIVRFERTEE